MAENKDGGEKKGAGNEKPFDPEQRFRYVGFEVYQGKKIKDFFKSSSERESWVQKVLKKREKGGALREDNQFDVPRVAGYEKIVLTITSLILIASLFLPWFSGYTEHTVETEAPVVEETGIVDSLMADSLMDSTAILAGADSLTMSDTTLAEVAAVTEGATENAEDDGILRTEKDDKGFASIAAVRTRKEIIREPAAVSALGALGLLFSDGGKFFSSGIAVMLTAILLLIYILLCILMAVYTLYLLYAGKSTPDEKALQIKKGLRINWAPIAIWAIGLMLSFTGTAYSFDTSEMVKQIGESYGPATYLGLLSYGFYISMAAFIMNAVKGSEI